MSDIADKLRAVREIAYRIPDMAVRHEMLAELPDPDALGTFTDASEDLRAWVHSLGNAEAWRGTMGDDQQGHDEGALRAQMMLERFDAALAKLEKKP